MRFRNIIIGFSLPFLFAGGNGERIPFTSANPFSYYHVITDLENQDPQEVFGILRFPEGVDHKNLPLVIGSAGSLDWGKHHMEYLAMYREMGIATFELQSFASRGINSTVGTQIEVTSAMMILDAYRALEALSNDPRIDTDRAAITGWSLGGSVALFSAWQPLKQAINPDISFTAHLPIYPPCIFELDVMEFTDAPIHILIGDLDDWVPADACENLVTEMQLAGIDADITVYQGAHHSFDSKNPLMVIEGGYKVSDCLFRMRSDGAVLMNFMNIPMTSPLRQKFALALCADRGPTLGGHPPSREASFAFARSFMAEHLLNRDE